MNIPPMQRKRIIAGMAIAMAGFAFQVCLEHWTLPYAKKDGYFQRWSSEDMTQTVSIEDLRDAPLQSLFNIHIQPPAFDIIRAVLAQIWNTGDSHLLLHRVDHSIYVLWAILDGLLGALIFWWLSQMTRMGFAIAAALIFLAHPACICYASFLDTTILSALLILWAYYLLWKFRENPRTSITVLTVAVLILFFTRAIFQWPSLLVFAASLFLLRVPVRRVIIFLAITGTLTGLYLGKQYLQFGILSTSSFSGLNLVKSIGWPFEEYRSYLKGHAVLDPAPEPDKPLPGVLARKWKFTGSPNFNHLSYLRMNRYLMKEYKKQVRAMPISQLAMSYIENLWIYFRPSSSLEKDLIVEHIPWRTPYDRIFSYPILPAMLVMAAGAWAWRARRKGWSDYAAGLALALPGLFIFAVSVLSEKGENMRYKFFWEPVMFVFIASQIHVIGREICRKVRRPRAPTDRDAEAPAENHEMDQ